MAGMNMAGMNMAGMNMAGMDMAGMDMAGMNMAGMDMAGMDMADMDTVARPARAERAAGHRRDAAEPGRLPIIRGSVGPAYDISVKPRKVPPGRYKLVVRDLNGAHNWHIFGPGVDKATSVEGSGRTVWWVNFVAGKYHVQCDPHAPVMHTKLKVR
jgi:hypothetical protein